MCSARDGSRPRTANEPAGRIQAPSCVKCCTGNSTFSARGEKFKAEGMVEGRSSRRREGSGRRENGFGAVVRYPGNHSEPRRSILTVCSATASCPKIGVDPCKTSRFHRLALSFLLHFPFDSLHRGQPHLIHTTTLQCSTLELVSPLAWLPPR